MINKPDLVFATVLILFFLLANLCLTALVWAEVKELREELKKRL